MITEIKNLPENMVGFKATGDVTKEDFDNILLPAVKAKTDQVGKLNYMLVLDTSIQNFTFGAWMKDAWLGIKNLTKWNRGAIVSNSQNIKMFTDGFSYIVPGEFKGFFHEDMNKAINWVSQDRKEH
ncbi:MAG: STAS/SEC14 domain-containing protein [Opitutaceae bacterium]|nr:STAS/SEC14 domain-containing protein [Cytophagales bacterium]